MKKIGIVGGGAVGLTYAALLAKQAEVNIVVRRAEQAESINNKGISFQDRGGNEIFVGKVNASDDFSIIKECDSVIIAVKSYDTVNIVESLNANVRQNAIILTLQNGIEAYDVLRSHVNNPERVFAGVTYVGASRKDDRTVVNGTSFVTIVDTGIGELAKIMQSDQTLEVTVSNESKKAVWDKLALSVAQNGLSASENKHFGELLASDECLAKASSLLEEFVAVARAEGLTYDIEDLMKRLRDNWTDSTFYPSTWQDIHTGRKTEIDALNGAICKLGKEHSIDTPNNDAMTKAIKALEKS